jgi:hypothetical protein
MVIGSSSEGRGREATLTEGFVRRVKGPVLYIHEESSDPAEERAVGRFSNSRLSVTRARTPAMDESTRQ